MLRLTADKTRPSIILGDLNFNGRNLGLSGSEYGNALKTLHLGPTSMDAGDKAPADDLYPWKDPFGFDWDIDHADVARQQFADSLWLANGLGSFIGLDGPDDGPITSPAVPGAPGRLDYIFVRPPVQPGDPNFASTTWVVGKSDSAATWTSPWPTLLGPVIDSVGGRLSDHKPVVSAFKLVQMQVPPKFHPSWTHALTYRVTSANASNEDDCFLCGGLDLYTQIKKRQVSTSAVVSAPVSPGAICDGEGGAVALGVNACVSSWGFKVKHDPKLMSVQGGGAQLWESDSTSADDFFGTVWFNPAAQFAVNWSAQRVELRDFDTDSVKPCLDSSCSTQWNDRSIADNSPQGVCTRTTPPFLCMELQWTEIPPGP